MQIFRSLCEDGEVSGPVSVQEIEHAERDLGVIFPREYREFLEEFGAVLCRGAEIYGLPDMSKNDPPLWQGVVTVANYLREIGQIGENMKHLLPISEDGTGIYFFIDTSKSPDTSILAIGPGVNKFVSSKFYDFFVDLSEGKVSL